MQNRDAIISFLTDCIENQKPYNLFVNKIAIHELMAYDDLEIRILIAKMLAINPNKDDAVMYLSLLAKDPEPDVRLEAIDSLCAFPCCKSYNILCAALEDTDELIRAYAVHGVATIGETVAPEHAVLMLRNIEKSEKTPYVLVFVYEGLYILGIKNMLNQLIDLFYGNNYYVQCAVLRALEYILDEHNRETIFKFVHSLKYSEYSTAVNNAIIELIAHVTRGL